MVLSSPVFHRFLRRFRVYCFNLVNGVCIFGKRRGVLQWFPRFQKENRKSATEHSAFRYKIWGDWELS